jgi:hypothetical protein
MDVNELSLYNPMVLSETVKKMTTPDNLILLNRVPKRPYGFLTVAWDIIRGSRSRGQFNTIGAEAHVVARLGRAKGSAEGLSYREKKLFEPNTVQMIRAAGSLDRIAVEEEIMLEVADLNLRADNLAEWTLWQMLSGTLDIDVTTGTQVVAASVDYKMLATHKPQTAIGWDTASPQNIVSDINAWKRLIKKDSQVPALEVFATEETIDYIFKAFASTSLSSGTGIMGSMLLSDRMKEQYFNTGKLTGFGGLTWTPVEIWWEDSAGTEHQFLSDNALFMVNLRDNRPWELKQLPVYDFDAPLSHRGKFSKVWVEKDPSWEQHLLAWNFLPILTRPEQIICVADVTNGLS